MPSEKIADFCIFWPVEIELKFEPFEFRLFATLVLRMFFILIFQVALKIVTENIE